MSIFDKLTYFATNADIGPIQVGQDELGPGVGVTADGGTLDGVLNLVFALIGALSVLFLIIGAIRYVLSAGDASQLQKAKDTMLYAIVGVLVALSAFAIVAFVSSGVSSGI